jgi:hypothetical protein
LDGILHHESIVYEGIERPTEIIRAFDRPSKNKLSNSGNDKTGEPSKVDAADDSANIKILQEYWNDLYGLFMRKFSQFITEPDIESESEVKLQAMLQELIKVKKLLAVDNNVEEEMEKEIC